MIDLNTLAASKHLTKIKAHILGLVIVLVSAFFCGCSSTFLSASLNGGGTNSLQDKYGPEPETVTVWFPPTTRVNDANIEEAIRIVERVVHNHGMLLAKDSSFFPIDLYRYYRRKGMAAFIDMPRQTFWDKKDKRPLSFSQIVTDRTKRREACQMADEVKAEFLKTFGNSI